MRLLFVTQVLDEKDPVLGFVTRWVEELALRVEKIEVICLREGKHTFPSNVRVHSLGKEGIVDSRPSTVGSKILNKIRYTIRFKRLAWSRREEYDAIFVHMNQEYILIAGPMWKFLGKKIYMWRNHYKGNWLTDLAASFCDTVFCTSKYSYTAHYKKTVLMPVGVDTKIFTPDESVRPAPHSILFLSRMSPSKRPEMLIEALSILNQKGIAFTATFVGSPNPEEEKYYTGLSKRVLEYGLEHDVSFMPAVTKDQAVDIFRSHEIFVNCSPSGMFDKTLFEAAACDCLVLATSIDFKEAVRAEYFYSEDTAVNLALKLQFLLTTISTERESARAILAAVVQANSLSVLIARLCKEVSESTDTII